MANSNNTHAYSLPLSMDTTCSLAQTAVRGVHSLSDTVLLPTSNPQLNIPARKCAHPHKHTPCIVFSYAQLLMDKQRAVNCDGLSADIFPSHILEAQETYTRAGTVKREEKLKVKLARCSGRSHTRAHINTQACARSQMCMNVFTNRYK